MSSMTRRSFYVGAAAALSAVRVLGANDRIRIGIVGLGGRGSDHQRAYSTIPEARITALCDVNQAARERAQARVTKAGLEPALEFNDMRGLFIRNHGGDVSLRSASRRCATSTRPPASAPRRA